MTLVLILLAVFNVGFLVGTWWGSGWRRRERSELGRQIQDLELEILSLTGAKPTDSIVYFPPRTKKQLG